MATTTAANVRSQSVLKSYVALTKPSIISLLVFTALGGMFLASEGLPDPMLAILVLGGGALAAGGANALNHYLDRDIDVLMSRTANRPIVSGHIPPAHAMWFGISLNVIAFAVLASLVNPISAVLTLSATLFYVFVYTKGLKRSTPQNIVIGGAAGAIPPVVGWVAVTGELGMPALVMFIIVFCWTPPHFWALSLLIKDDYSRAGVPMLPVVAGVDETKKSIFRYSIAAGGPHAHTLHSQRSRMGISRRGVRSLSGIHLVCLEAAARSGYPGSAGHVSLLARVLGPAVWSDYGG